ncbi:MAG: M28 family peptidase [Bacteroidia bacterium]|nr:M28 family peptidase [Bacteroidia bacterium]
MKRYFTLLIILGSALGLIAQNDWEMVQSTVSKDIIKAHMYFLASDELKGRETGSHEGNVAALYLANQLRKYGVKDVPGTDKPYYQSIPVNKLSPPTSMEFKLGEQSTPSLIWLKGADVSKSAPLIYLNHGLAQDYEGKDVKDKWVVVRAGAEEEDNLQSAIGIASTKRKLAMEFGAFGLIEVSSAPERAWRSLSFYFNRKKTSIGELVDFPHVWVPSSDIDLEKVEGAAEASLKLEGITNEKLTSQNIVGMVEGTDSVLKKEFIIYSAHYDHVGTGKPDKSQDSVFNGARDNAVGTVTVLSMAENLAKFPTKRSALFILFTGEEKGLLGSQYYVEHPLLPLDKMVFCFNSDNGGYNDKTLATIIGLNRTTAARNIIDAAKMAGLRAIDDPAPEQNLFDRSDNVSFAAKGIPAPTYSLGFTAFDKEINRFYHQRSDQADNLDYEYLYKFFLSYVLSGRYIANDSKTPFWVEGDKYFEAGKELYEK